MPRKFRPFDKHTSFNVQSSGFDELNDKLSRLEFRTQRSVVTKAYRKGINVVKARAKQLAPKKTGRLRKGITTRVSSGMRGVRAKVVTRDRAYFGISADDPYYYPAIVEYGAPSQGIKPHSYMRKAMDERLGRAMTVIKRHIKVGVLRLARK